jgi:hypothetical protein
MLCGRCCVTEPPTKLALRLDIFIEILLRGWVNKLLSKRLSSPGGIMDVVANPLEKGRCTREQG